MPSIGDSLELTPKDLRNFNKKMTDEILQAQKDGWRGHVNRQGHVSMLAPDGKDTVVVSANQNAINQLLLGINRYRRRMGETVVEEEVKPKVPQKWPCARPTCPKVYATEEQLNIHIAVDHEKRIKCPDCNETFKAANVVGRHRQLKHGYVSPNKAKRKAQEAKRAQKDVELTGEPQNTQGTIVETVEKVLQVGSEGAQEAGESTGRNIADGVKFDPSISMRYGSDVDIKVDDVFVHYPMTPEQRALKDLAGKLINTEEVPSFEASPKFVQHISNPPKVVDAAAIYREAHNQLNNVRSKEPQVHLSVDLEQIMDLDIRTVAQVLHAAGLKLTFSADRKDS